MAAPAAPMSAGAAARLGPVANLAALPEMSHYRERPQDELEEAAWPVDPQQPLSNDLTEPAMVRLESLASRFGAYPAFVNASSSAVRTIWLNYQGHEVAYQQLEPGTHGLQPTYVSHPWIVREVATGRRMMLGGSMVYVASVWHSRDRVAISEPPALPWSMAHHRLFPEPFKGAVRALLLAHHRLGKAPVGAASAAAPVAVGSTRPRRKCASYTTMAGAAGGAAAAAAEAGLERLGSLPLELVHHIAGCMAPGNMPQDASMPASARPGIAPARLSEDPLAFAARKAQLAAAQVAWAGPLHAFNGLLIHDGELSEEDDSEGEEGDGQLPVPIMPGLEGLSSSSDEEEDEEEDEEDEPEGN